MSRTRMWDVALVAMACGVLAFEVVGLRGALPAAWGVLAERGVVAEATEATTRAALGTGRAFGRAGLAASRVAAGVATQVARQFGTVTRGPAVAGGGAPERGAPRPARRVHVHIVEARAQCGVETWGGSPSHAGSDRGGPDASGEASAL